MDFARKKIKGQNKKVRRTWMSPEKYRIIWRCEAFGIALPARFQATVRVFLPNGEMWDFVARQRLFKTLKAAKEACEKHYRLWTKAAEATGLRKLEELFGKVPFGYPVWVRGKLNRNVYGLITDTTVHKRKDIEICDSLPVETTEPLETSASTTEPPKDDPGPVSCVEEKAMSTGGRKPRSSTTVPESSVPPVAETGKVRKRRVAKPTKSPSKSTKRRKRTTKDSSASEDKPSTNSRKKSARRSRS